MWIIWAGQSHYEKNATLQSFVKYVCERKYCTVGAKLAETYPNRLKAVIKAKCGSTKQGGVPFSNSDSVFFIIFIYLFFLTCWCYIFHLK